MKIQDIAFILAFVVLLLAKQPKLFVYAGLGMLFLSIPLFATWTFFTAERLTWYAAAFFLMAVAFSFVRPHKVK